MISYNSVSDTGSATGEPNVQFALPLLGPNTDYNFTISTIVNLTLIVEVQMMFHSGNCEIYFIRYICS